MFECQTRQGITHQAGFELLQVSENIWEMILTPREPGDLCQLQVIIVNI